MSLYDNLNNSNTSNAQPNARKALEELKSNTRGVLERSGLNVPDGMTNPQQIVNHLVQSGQVPQARLQMAQRMVGMMGR